MELLVKLVEGIRGNRGGGLDTGWSRALVHRKVVPKEEFLEERATMVRCAHRDTVLYPLAKVRMEPEKAMIIMTKATVRKQKEEKAKEKQLEEKCGVTSNPLMKKEERIEAKGNDRDNEEEDKSESLTISKRPLSHATCNGVLSLV